MIGRFSPAGARHKLTYNRGISRDVFLQKGNNGSDPVVSQGSRFTSLNDRDGFILVESGLGKGQWGKETRA
jgi:hypothetical protein